MGNNCSQRTPELRNKLSDGLNDIGRSFNETDGFNSYDYQEATEPKNSRRTIWGFCAGATDKSVRKSYCSELGNGEWEYRSAANSCTFSDCNSGQYQESGCCGWCCGIAGKGVTCKRKKFNGELVPCCLNDYAGCGATSIPNDPCKFNLGFSNDNTGVGISHDSVGTSIENCVPNSNTGPGWSCLQQNCQKTCDPCLRSVTTGNNTVHTGEIDGKTFSRACTDKIEGSKSSAFESSYLGYKGCRKVLLEYCTGQDLPKGDISWTDRWMDSTGAPRRYGCLNVLVRNIFDTSRETVYGYGDGTVNPSDGNQLGCRIVDSYFANITSGNIACQPFTLGNAIMSNEGVDYSKLLVYEVSKRYSDDGFRLGSLPGDQSYNIFQEFLYANVFCKLPFISQDTLLGSCSIYKIEDLENNPNVGNLCGCMLPDGEYSKYVDQFQVDKECTPMCNKPTTVKLVDQLNSPRICRQSNCIIDDVAIRLANTTVNGTINVNEMCNNCSVGSGSSCSCILSESVLNSQGQVNNINTGFICTSLLCSVINPDTGQTVTMKCSDVDQSANVLRQRELDEQRRRREAVRTRNRNLLIIVFFFILAIIIAGFIIKPYFYDPKERIIRAKKKAGPSTRSFGSEVGISQLDPVGGTPFMNGTPSTGSSSTISEFGTGVGIEEITV
jgi:hypothetical protein